MNGGQRCLSPGWNNCYQIIALLSQIIALLSKSVFVPWMCIRSLGAVSSLLYKLCIQQMFSTIGAEESTSCKDHTCKPCPRSQIMSGGGGASCASSCVSHCPLPCDRDPVEYSVRHALLARGGMAEGRMASPRVPAGNPTELETFRFAFLTFAFIETAA
jgi:hypothetical protein